MTLRRAIFIGVSLLWVHISYALTEGEFIEHILSNPQYFAKDKIYLDIKQIELDSSFKNYIKWQSELSVEFENSYYNINKVTTSSSIYEKKRRNNSQKVSLSIDKYFVTSPISFSVDISREFPSKDITRFKKDTFYNTYEIDEYNTSASISIDIPLLKPNAQALLLKTYERNKFDLLRERFDYIDSQEDFIVDKLKDFLEIAFLKEENKVYQGYISELQLYTSKKYYKNLISSIYRLIERNINKIVQLQKDIKISLNDNSLDLDNISLNYLKQFSLVDDLRRYLIKHNRDLLRYDIDKALKRIDIAYYEKQILPELDLVFSIQRNQDIGNTLSTVYDNNSTEYTSELIYSIPLGGDTYDEKNLAVAELNLQKINLDYSSKLNDIISATKSLISSLESNDKLIQNYPVLLDRMKQDAIKNYQEEKYLDVIVNLDQKYETMLEYVELVYEHQLEILEYNDYLDNIVR